MKTHLNVKTGEFGISFKPDADQKLISFFGEVREDARLRGMRVPPPIDFSAIEGSEEVWSTIKYEYIEFVIFFLEILFRSLENPAASALVKIHLDQIKEWHAEEQKMFSSTVH